MADAPFDEPPNDAGDFEKFPLTDAQKAEIGRRVVEHARDSESATLWEGVRRRLRRRFE